MTYLHGTVYVFAHTIAEVLDLTALPRIRLGGVTRRS
jgi:hypothetical protein